MDQRVTDGIIRWVRTSAVNLLLWTVTLMLVQASPLARGAQTTASLAPSAGPDLTGLKNFPLKLASRTYDLMDQERFDDLYDMLVQSTADKSVFHQLMLVPWNDLRQVKIALNELVKTPRMLPTGLRARAYQVLAAMEKSPAVAESIKAESWKNATFVVAERWTIGGCHLQFNKDVEQIAEILGKFPALREKFIEGLLRFSRQAKGYEGPESLQMALEILLEWGPGLQQRVMDSLESIVQQPADSRTKKNARMAQQNLQTLWTVNVKGRSYDLTQPAGLQGFLSLEPGDQLYVLDNLELVRFVFENANRSAQIGQAISSLKQPQLDGLAQTLSAWAMYPDPIQSNVRRLIPILDRIRGTVTPLPVTPGAAPVFAGNPNPVLAQVDAAPGIRETIAALQAGDYGASTLAGLFQIKKVLEYRWSKKSIRYRYDENKAAEWQAGGELDNLVAVLGTLKTLENAEFKAVVANLLALDQRAKAEAHQRVVRWRLFAIIGIPLILGAILAFLPYAYPYVRFAGKRVRKEHLFPVAEDFVNTAIRTAKEKGSVLRTEMETALERLRPVEFETADRSARLPGLGQGLRAILNGQTEPIEMGKHARQHVAKFLGNHGVDDQRVVELMAQAFPGEQEAANAEALQLAWLEEVLEQVQPVGHPDLKSDLQRLIRKAKLIGKIATIGEDPDNLPDADEVLEGLAMMKVNIDSAITASVQAHRVHWAAADVLRKHHSRLIRADFKKRFHVGGSLARHKEVRSGKRISWRVWDKDSDRIRDSRVPQKQTTTA